jgi:cellulose synthase/poly-beta-1,6-N-acetylglucosamine synthase-like glycosyltransferase
MTAPILSVIIPVYNEEQTLPQLFGVCIRLSTALM